MTNNPAILLYDGTCGFCDGAVKFVLRVDRVGTMRFAALESDFGAAVLARHPELAGVDSVVYVQNPDRGDERVFVRVLRSYGVTTTVRDTRGREIDGACGQLAASG